MAEAGKRKTTAAKTLNNPETRLINQTLPPPYNSIPGRPKGQVFFLFLLPFAKEGSFSPPGNVKYFVSGENEKRLFPSCFRMGDLEVCVFTAFTAGLKPCPTTDTRLRYVTSPPYGIDKKNTLA